MRLKFKKYLYRGANWMFYLVLRLAHRPRVALISTTKWRYQVLDDLMLQNQLLKKGFAAQIIDWHDLNIEYSQFQALIVTSMWDYSDFLDEFKEWQNKIRLAKRPIFNPLDLIKENCDKALQYDFLNKQHFPVVKTCIIRQKTSDFISEFEKEAKTFKTKELVLKPSISGGGKNTFKVDTAKIQEYQPTIAEILKNKALLVQPFVPEIKNGELALIYIGGKFSHAVRRYPQVLRRGGHHVFVPTKEIPAEVLKTGDKIAALKENQNALYFRLDLVQTRDGFLIMELEMFEPQLYFYLLPKDLRKRALEKYVANFMEKLKTLD